MNLLVVGFGILNVFMLVFGLLVNFGNSLPKCVVQLFRYGRANISNAKPAYVKSIEVPKRWFFHFYLFAVILQLSVCICIIRGYYLGAQSTCLLSVLDVVGDRSITVDPTTTVVASLLFLFHLSRRLYETLRVSVYSNTKMNLLHYFLAYIHYTGAILCMIAHSPMTLSETPIDSTSSFGKIKFFSISVFFLGNFIQHRAHVGLANLRKRDDDKKQATGHKIPRGELFEYISCPNYFGEIIIYCAMAGLFGLSNASWNSCTVWVICNQIMSGIMNHLWYHSAFKEYPKSRKAIIPYIL